VTRLDAAETFRTYVYEIIDPRNGLAFYVGSGSEGRVRTSGTVACSVGQPKKLAIVKAIRASGLKPIPRIVSVHLSRDEAFAAEGKHIDWLELVQGVKLVNKYRAPLSGLSGNDTTSVYEVIDQDGQIFHVGFNYTSLVKSGEVIKRLRAEKADRARAMLLGGLEPTINIVATYKTWIDALRARSAHLAEVVKSPKFAKLSRADQGQRPKLKTKRSARNKRGEAMPPLISWCGEASDYLVPCPYLPVFCVPRRFT
jgi:hypothetical protein